MLPRFRCCPYAEATSNTAGKKTSTAAKGVKEGTVRDMKRCANELAQCSLLHVLDIAALVNSYFYFIIFSVLMHIFYFLKIDFEDYFY